MEASLKSQIMVYQKGGVLQASARKNPFRLRCIFLFSRLPSPSPRLATPSSSSPRRSPPPLSGEARIEPPPSAMADPVELGAPPSPEPLSPLRELIDVPTVVYVADEDPKFAALADQAYAGFPFLFVSRHHALAYKRMDLNELDEEHSAHYLRLRLEENQLQEAMEGMAAGGEEMRVALARMETLKKSVQFHFRRMQYAAHELRKVVLKEEEMYKKLVTLTN
uniref:Uncharacterized protein n=1 Tax=Oryza glumipatula TaxID=40148 RepID=A0A0E0ABS0_9ORYZ